MLVTQGYSLDVCKLQTTGQIQIVDTFMDGKLRSFNIFKWFLKAPNYFMK